METYTFLREFADSWMLLALFMFYVTACAWALSPARKAANADAAEIPFRNDQPRASDDVEDNTNPSDDHSTNREGV